MRSRCLAGWKGILLATAVATLVFLPVLDTPAQEIQSSSTYDDEMASSLRDGGKLGRPTLYNRANYSWPFASGPYYESVNLPEWGASGVRVQASVEATVVRAREDEQKKAAA